MARILVAGVNPAWQQVFVLPHLRPGEVQRASESFALASGKGMNAAKVLAGLGHEVSLLQVVAGRYGERMREACEALGVDSLHVEAAGETRTATTLLHDGKATEVIGNFRVDDASLPRALLDRIPEGPEYDALLVCGTLPQGFGEDFHRGLLQRAKAARVIWDSVAGLDAVTAPRVTWLKVNAAEHALLRRRLEEYGARPATLVTDGPDKARVEHAPGAGTYALPRIEALNPIGAGDTVTAMLAHGLLSGWPADVCVRRALAAGTASCLSPLPATWNAGDAERFEEEIAWKP
jgi:fructose-1-phosphate kinase PfkB-like protein